MATAGQTVFRDVNVTIVAGTPQAVWTPTTGTKFILQGYALSVSVASAVIFKDAAAVLFRSPTLAANTPCVVPSMAEGKTSALANNALNLDATVGCTVTGVIFGDED